MLHGFRHQRACRLYDYVQATFSELVPKQDADRRYSTMPRRITAACIRAAFAMSYPEIAEVVGYNSHSAARDACAWMDSVRDPKSDAYDERLALYAEHVIQRARIDASNEINKRHGGIGARAFTPSKTVTT